MVGRHAFFSHHNFGHLTHGTQGLPSTLQRAPLCRKTTTHNAANRDEMIEQPHLRCHHTLSSSYAVSCEVYFPPLDHVYMIGSALMRNSTAELLFVQEPIMDENYRTFQEC